MYYGFSSLIRSQTEMQREESVSCRFCRSDFGPLTVILHLLGCTTLPFDCTQSPYLQHRFQQQHALLSHHRKHFCKVGGMISSQLCSRLHLEWSVLQRTGGGGGYMAESKQQVSTACGIRLVASIHVLGQSPRLLDFFFISFEHT